MNSAEFKEAFAIADDESQDLSKEDLSMFDGYGLQNFPNISATKRQLARLMRWQCLGIYHKIGTPKPWDMDALQEIKNCLRYKLTVL